MTKSDTDCGKSSHAESAVHGNKEAAVQFLQLIVAGRIEEAYRKYVDVGGKHHNPFFPAGFPALQKAMSDNHVKFPNKQIAVKHVLGDGDLVAVHSHIILRPGETGVAAVHLFRFQGDKVVEMWDCGLLRQWLKGRQGKQDMPSFSSALPDRSGDYAGSLVHDKRPRTYNVHVCKVEGMGHVWPSGSQYLSAQLVGPVSYDISTQQIWDFFQQHPLTR